MIRGVYRIAILVAVFLAAGVASAEGSDILYWMVDENATINRWWGDDAGTYTIGDYFSDFYPADSEFAARVRVTGGNLPDDTFLRLYYRDENNNPQLYDGDFGIPFFETESGYWGAGVPTGNQSPSGDYSSGTPEYSFIVEIGNIVDDEWTTVAVGETKTYSELSSDYIHPTYDMTPSALQIWTPVDFSAVPEPSGGLLTLLGFAVLALRRKRPDEEA